MDELQRKQIIADDRQWAITVVERYVTCDCQKRSCLHESVAEALRAINGPGLLTGLIDLAAQLVDSTVEHSGLSHEEVFLNLRVNADG